MSVFTNFRSPAALVVLLCSAACALVLVDAVQTAFASTACATAHAVQHVQPADAKRCAR